MNSHILQTTKILFLNKNGINSLRRNTTIQFARMGILACILTLPLWTACSRPNDGPDSNQTTDSDSEPTEAINQGMEFFDGAFEEALALAEEEDKLVFVDVYTMWCGPCIVMQETVFPLPEIGEFFNERFVNLKLDMENEEQNGPELGTRYKIGVVPTYLILDTDGTELGRATGGASAIQFISMITRVLGESTSTFVAMQNRYDSGERSSEFIQQYLSDAIVELAFREIDNQDSTSVRAYFDEGAKYKKVAEEYFASRPYAELINERDARFIMYFLEREDRGNELVEFVLANYDEFLDVSSESAMAQFTLNTTLGAVASAARAGDEKFVDYINDLDAYPLKKAVDHERNRYPDSNRLPERMKASWELDYLKAKGDWNEIAAVYESRFQEWGDKATAGHFQWASSDLRQSSNPNHHEVAVEYGRRAFSLDNKSPYVAVTYISALVTVDKTEEAHRIANEYRTGLTESEVDVSNLELFDNMSSSWLDKNTKASNSGD